MRIESLYYFTEGVEYGMIINGSQAEEKTHVFRIINVFRDSFENPLLNVSEVL